MADEHVEERAVWLYAVARGLRPGSLATLRGVGGGGVHAVPVDTDPAPGNDTGDRGGFTAVVSPVPLPEYGADALHRHLEDLDWLAETARAHDAVVAAVSGAATATVPLRLATVCFDEERARELVRERRSEFDSALSVLEGRTEWGVKVYADPERPAGGDTDRADATDTAPAGARGSGAAYLRRRKAQLSARESAERVAAEHADRLHAAFATVAVAGRRHPPQDPRLSGERARMVLNGAYLVDDSRAEEFAALVARLDAEHAELRIELTGPWPPYSFAAVDPTAGPAAEPAGEVRS